MYLFLFLGAHGSISEKVLWVVKWSVVFGVMLILISQQELQDHDQLICLLLSCKYMHSKLLTDFVVS